MYNLINIYSVPMPPEDLAVFATLQPCISSLQDVLDDAVAKRDSTMNMFCTCLNKDKKELTHEVWEVLGKMRSQVQKKPFLPIHQQKKGEYLSIFLLWAILVKLSLHRCLCPVFTCWSCAFCGVSANLRYNCRPLPRAYAAWGGPDFSRWDAGQGFYPHFLREEIQGADIFLDSVWRYKMIHP